MTIVVTGLAGWRSGAANIGYDNLLKDATLSATTQQDGYEVSALKNWLFNDKWRGASTDVHYITIDNGTAKEASCFGLFRHNLGDSGALVELQGSSNGTAWTTVYGPITVTSNRALFRVFTPVTYRYFRLKISGLQSPPIISVMQLGPVMQLYSGMEPGFTPPNLGRSSEVMNSESEGGDFLGRSIKRRGYSTSIALSVVSAAWVRDVWDPFIDHAEINPFFFAWNINAYPDEVALCYTTGKIPEPRYGSSGVYMSLSLNMRAHIL